LKALYSELEFHSLVDELEAASPGSVEEVPFRTLGQGEAYRPAVGPVGIAVVPLGTHSNLPPGAPTNAPMADTPEGETGELPLGVPPPPGPRGEPRYLFAISEGTETVVGEDTDEALAARLARLRGLAWVSA